MRLAISRAIPAPHRSRQWRPVPPPTDKRTGLFVVEQNDSHTAASVATVLVLEIASYSRYCGISLGDLLRFSGVLSILVLPACWNNCPCGDFVPHPVRIAPPRNPTNNLFVSPLKDNACGRVSCSRRIFFFFFSKKSLWREPEPRSPGMFRLAVIDFLLLYPALIF